MKRFQFVLALLTVGLVGSAAQAAINLKQVHLTNPSQIDLLFDNKVTKNNVKVEFFNDIIQLSLMDVSVYPAKISSINTDNVTKIFAYQYAPKLVRCRLTVKGKAEDYRNRIKLVHSGKIMTIRFEQITTDQITTRASKSVAVEMDSEEKALMEKVVKGTEKPAGQTAQPAAQPAKQAPAEKDIAVSKTKPMAEGKALISPFKVFGKFSLVVLLFGVIALFLKKKQNGVVRAINKFARNGFGKNAKMIEVVSTHYLGPKKSIAVVRVAGRLLVLGITNDSINLISQISGDQFNPEALGDLGISDLDSGVSAADSFMGPAVSAPIGGVMSKGSGAIAAGPSMFSDILSTEKSKPSVSPNVRAKIRSRLEGLKPL